MSQNQRKVVNELKELYFDRLLPIEKTYLFNKFNNSEIIESEMNSKPTILLVGQYSTGKTTFIRNLIGMDYPEMHIGPEPTTDRFIAVVYGPESKLIKGNALTGVTDLPFSGLSTFGSGFLNKFCASIVPAPLLKQVNIIDTPGVLSGEKQRTSRGYDFSKVSKWFAERSDMILLMFDPSKLDISDEFKSVIEELRPYEDKVCCVLNKADTLDGESLMRVYGALLWSMGKVFRGAEVTRVYVGSFKDEPYIRNEHEELFIKDRKVLMSKLQDLPKACSMRKVNEMVKRIRLGTINVCLLGYLRSKLPYLWGHHYIQERLIHNLPEIFQEIKHEFDISEGDFPDVSDYQAVLKLLDFSTFPQTKKEVLLALREMLTEDIPKIMSKIHKANNDDEIDGDSTLKSTVATDAKEKIIMTTTSKGKDERSSKFDVTPTDSKHVFKNKKNSNTGIAIILLSILIQVLVVAVGLVIVYIYLTPSQKAEYFTREQSHFLDQLVAPISDAISSTTTPRENI